MDWRDQIIAALKAWLEIKGGPSPGRAPPRPVIIAEAHRESEPGWYVADLRGRSVNAEALEDLHLELPGGERCSVMETVQEGDLLRIRVAPSVVTKRLPVKAVRRSSSYLTENLLRSFERLRDPAAVANSLARGYLSEPPQVSDGVLKGAQNQAYAACFRPGLYLVWGPPGTGKTMILGRAIERLLDEGKSVLLVSGTNVAVDTALREVARKRPWQSGQLVRVGPPHLREIARDQTVSLPLLAQARCGELEAERRVLEDRLRAIQGRASGLRDLENTLADYDHDAYVTARDRLAGEARIAEEAKLRESVETERRRASQLLQRASADAQRAQAALGGAREAWDHVRKASDLQRILADLDAAAAQKESNRLRLQRELEQRLNALNRLTGEHWLARLWTGKTREDLGQDISRLRWAVSHAQSLSREASEHAAQQRRLFEPEIAAHLGQAGPVDVTTIVGLTRELDRAQDELSSARERERTCSEELARLDRRLDALRSQPAPTMEDRILVKRAEQADWPARHADGERLAEAVRAVERDQAALERRHERVLTRMKELRKDIEGEIIHDARLVATTLARFRLHPAVHEREYDVVLVDEAGAALVPEVLLAVARSRQTAVLFGDFLQLSAVMPEADRLRKLKRREVDKWLLEGVFSLCGIRDADDLDTERARVVVLTEQHRFGPAIRDLANRCGYGGRLTGARPSVDDPEIVLIDTDGLDDLGTVRRTSTAKGWWPAGSLIASALAQHHVGQGESVGVVTPYNLQVQATAEALRDIEEGEASAEVGTVHRFQGRQFNVVCFDLVEDGLSQPGGWMSRASWNRGAWERDGARLFNVGITRAQRRLYLIGSQLAIRSAPEGGALARVAEAVDQGTLAVVRAGAAMYPGRGQRSTLEGPLTDEITQILGQYVRVVGIHDEHELFEALERHIREARKSIWIWAAWAARRLNQVLPLLEEAVGRGVHVTVFTRPDRDQPSDAMMARRLRAAVPRVIRMERMHQKIVIIDDQITMVGSCNVLSHHNTREVMLVHRGQRFAEQMLREERADELSRPPSCPTCGPGTMELRRSESARRGFPWRWRCSRCQWSQQLPIRAEAS